jgi:hypothetical protein
MRERQTIKTVALPAAAAAALTGAINVGTHNIGQRCEVHLELEATPSLVDTKKITVDLYESDTESGSYTVIPTTGNMVVTGAGGAGAGAKLFRIFLPPVHKPWIKGRAAVESGGGDNTAKKLTLAIDL